MLETLLERTRGEALPLPAALRDRYGGDLVFPSGDRPHVVANFVTTLDGIVSFGLPGRSAASLISRGDAADRFVLGLLRACADVVVVGAGTLRIERDHVWTAEHVFPDAAADFAALRAALGKPARPVTLFLTSHGVLDPAAAAFHDGGPVLVVTSSAGAKRLGALGRRAAIRATRGDRPTIAAALAIAAEETRARLILTEGGPTVLAEFLAEGALDELFLTVAPQLAGRSEAERRVGLVEGRAFAPEDATWGSLASVKRSSDYLFLRYALRS